MTVNHDAVAALPVLTQSNKALLRALAVKRFAYCLDTSESATNLVAVDPDAGTIPLYIIQNGMLFQFDPADSTTTNDGMTCLVTFDGKRYKLPGAWTGSLSFSNITGTIAAGQFPNGMPPGLGIANTFTDATDSTSHATGSQILNGGLGAAKSISTGQSLICDNDMSANVFATLDTSARLYTLASGATLSLPINSSGFLVATDPTSGSTAAVVMGGGAVVILGQSLGASWVATSTPTTSQVGIYYDGAGHYTIKNGFATSRTMYLAYFKTRPAA